MVLVSGIAPAAHAVDANTDWTELGGERPSQRLYGTTRGGDAGHDG
jgi:hypothetical protein